MAEAEQSETLTVLGFSITGIGVRISLGHGNMSMIFCIRLSCVGRGLASRSPTKESYQLCKGLIVRSKPQ
jgi:hypothetical protein